jgi:DUF177 domain-containing protein
MSGSLHAWYSLCDLGILAERKAALSGDIELSCMRRLCGLLGADGGSVTASLRFRQRYAGYVTVDLRCKAMLELQCQRCLEPMYHEVSEESRLALVESAAMEAHVPEDREPVLLEDGRLMPAGLIEDALIIVLPLAPRHRNVEECGALAATLDRYQGENGDVIG